MEKQVLVNESSLVNIADALRNKIGDTQRVFTPSAMSNAINEVSGSNLGKRINKVNTYSGESKPLQGVVDKTNKEIIFDLSSKIKPGDCNWIFGTYCGSDNTSTKYLLMIHLLTTQIPPGTTEEIKINSYGVSWWQNGKSGNVTSSSSPNAVFPNALYIDAYYNPATCILRIDYSSQLFNYFPDRVDKYGQLIYRVEE